MQQTEATAADKDRAEHNIDEVLGRLRGGVGGDVPLVDLMAVAEHLVGSMQTIFSALDSSVFREFGSIADSISNARAEIGRLQPRDLSEDRIPEAGKELQAIVTATEDATHTIMGAAESILGAEAENLDAYRGRVEAEVMRIFEACSFQDITGQRVSKVVEALEDIDERVDRIAAAFGFAGGSPALSERQEARQERKRKLILNGPADPGEGVGQDDIDAMFG